MNYSQVSNGVYRAGFATSQEAYESAVVDVFNGLDKIEDILSKRRYLAGNQITEADVRIFGSLVRFDLVYVQHFKVRLGLNCIISSLSKPAIIALEICQKLK